MARTTPLFLNADLPAEIGARYISTKDVSLTQTSEQFGPFDFIFEATGFSPLVFEAMDALGKNGVLAMVSVTGGERTVEVPADHINQGFALGNKVAFGSVNASRADFESGVKDLAQVELSYSRWLSKLLTHPIKGLDNYRWLMRTPSVLRDRTFGLTSRGEDGRRSATQYSDDHRNRAQGTDECACGPVRHRPACDLSRDARAASHPQCAVSRCRRVRSNGTIAP